MDTIVIIDYTNWKGEREERKIRPLEIYFGENKWHSPAQWILVAEDVEKKDCRFFAMKDIHSWNLTS